MNRRILLAHGRFRRQDLAPQWKAYFKRFGYELEVVTSASNMERILEMDSYDLLIIGSSVGGTRCDEAIELARRTTPGIRVALYSNAAIDTKALMAGRLSESYTLPQVLGYVQRCFAPKSDPKKKK